MEILYSDPYMEDPYMIVEQHHQEIINFDPNVWTYIQEKHCSSPFIKITVKPSGCAHTGDGRYCVSWYGVSNRITLSIIENSNNKPHYSVTSFFQHKENTMRCPTLTALVMHLQEQLRNL